MKQRTKGYTFDILVDNFRVKEYEHQNKTYIEGRRNSEYELFFENNSNQEVLAIFSVDGLSVIDGKTASKESRGYIVKAYDSINVPGWTISNNKVAKFQFRPQGDRDNSTYVEELKKEGFDVDVSNQGVIGCMVFEKKKNYNSTINYHYYRPTYQPDYYYNNIPQINMVGSNMVRGYAGLCAASAASLDTMACLNPTIINVQEQSLGTAFGDETTFETVSTTFEKGIMTWTAVINYDTITNLKKIGVVKEKSDVNRAFPGDSDYCYIPRGKRNS